MKKDEDIVEQKLQNSVNTPAIQLSEDKSVNITDNNNDNSNNESTINNETKDVVSLTQSQPVQIESKSSLSSSSQIQSTVSCADNNTSSSLNNSKVDLNVVNSSGSSTPTSNNTPNSTSTLILHNTPIENSISLDSSSINLSTSLIEGVDFNKPTNSQTMQESVISLGNFFRSFLSYLFSFSDVLFFFGNLYLMIVLLNRKFPCASTSSSIESDSKKERPTTCACDRRTPSFHKNE
jgi:hypothetical protein